MAGQDSKGRYIPDKDTSSGAAVASAARTTTANGTAFDTTSIDELEATLVITAVTGTNPTMDVTLETSLDGTTFYAVPTAFPQQTATTTGVGRVFDGLSASSRWKWTIGGTATPTFTFSISATEQRV
jgi:hypothetical protein